MAQLSRLAPLRFRGRSRPTLRILRLSNARAMQGLLSGGGDQATCRVVHKRLAEVNRFLIPATALARQHGPIM